jgi:hypothetical protein
MISTVQHVRKPDPSTLPVFFRPDPEMDQGGVLLAFVMGDVPHEAMAEANERFSRHLRGLESIPGAGNN